MPAANNAVERDEPEDGLLHTLADCGGEEAPDLPEDDRQGDREAGVEADLQRRHEWFGDAEGHGLPPMRRQRLVEPVDQLVMKAVTDGEAAGQGDEDDDEPRAELAEMIDKLRGVIVAPGVEADALLRGLLVLALEARERPLGRNLVALGGNCKAVVLDRLVAGDRVLELAETATHRASHLREALRAEHEQDDETEQEDLWHSDEAGHLIPSVMSEMGRSGSAAPRIGPC
jgi:hypothetical protein